METGQQLPGGAQEGTQNTAEGKRNTRRWEGLHLFFFYSLHHSFPHILIDLLMCGFDVKRAKYEDKSSQKSSHERLPHRKSDNL